MQRLVYAPKSYAFVKNSTGDITDISSYIVEGDVDRKVNAVSTAKLVLRNPNMIFTSPVNGQTIFTPMDPITIYLERLHKRPVRVFTGYLDKSPYYEMYPGTVTLEASCTLKKLLYNYFDPALPYTRSFMKEYGWTDDGSGILINVNGLDEFHRPKNQTKGKEGSLAEILHATMNVIGGWKNEDIYVENLPPDLINHMTELYKSLNVDDDKARSEFQTFMHHIIGSGSLGAGGGGGATGTGVGVGQWVRTGFTVDNFSGGGMACGGGPSTHGGMTYAELGVVGASTKTGGYLGDLFGHGSDGRGLKCDTKLEFRNPKNNKTAFGWKIDNGHGQGNNIYTTDLEEPLANALGETIGSKGFIEVRMAQ